MPRFARRFVFGIGFLFVVFSAACEHSTPTVIAQQEQDAPPSHDVPQSREADDAARYIAGLPGTSLSPFAKLETTDAWKEHRRQLDEAWSRAEVPLVGGLQTFQREQLNDAALQKATLFYPFGGPDALTPILLFPRAPAYILVALEPAGSLPTVAQFEKKDAPKYLAEIRDTVDSELSRSFFITRQMDKQFRGQVTDGLLLPIMHLLVRTHNTILGFRYVRLDEQGKIIDRAVNYKAPTRYGNKGFELEFRSDLDQSIHRFYYFSVNLADDRLLENRPFLTYMAGLNNVTTLLKATSYMTHKKEFSMIREGILGHSAAVFQDDSGIPFHDFKPDAWKIQLYGEYSRPYGSFSWMEQPDLRKAYAAPGVVPLSLRLGYGYSKIASNLLLARKIGN